MLVLQIAGGILLAAIVLLIAFVALAVHAGERHQRRERGQFY